MKQVSKKQLTKILKHLATLMFLFNNAGYALVGAFEAMTNEQI
ncbi:MULTISPECIES: hypothetical protein [Flavobacterium]|nr:MULTISPECIES: hypothetical protein [Flavobacterium]